MDLEARSSVEVQIPKILNVKSRYYTLYDSISQTLEMYGYFLKGQMSLGPMRMVQKSVGVMESFGEWRRSGEWIWGTDLALWSLEWPGREKKAETSWQSKSPQLLWGGYGDRKANLGRQSVCLHSQMWRKERHRSMCDSGGTLGTIQKSPNILIVWEVKTILFFSLSPLALKTSNAWDPSSTNLLGNPQFLVLTFYKL